MREISEVVIKSTQIEWLIFGYESKPWYLVNPKIAGKWMFIPLKMVSIGIDPYPYLYLFYFQGGCFRSHQA